jgi:hypothetical protein
LLEKRLSGVREIVEGRWTVKGIENAEAEGNEGRDAYEFALLLFPFSLLHFLKVAFLASYVYPSFLFHDGFLLAVNSNNLWAMKTGMRGFLQNAQRTSIYKAGWIVAG